MSKPDYDTVIARIAGNIASGWGESVSSETEDEYVAFTARVSVSLARAIVAEVKRTQPFPYSADVQLMAALPSSPVESETP